MTFDPAILARIQFAFTVTFHIIFPTLSIGLALFLAIVEGLWLRTRDPIYLTIYRFWLTIFAMGFGVGVVTGIVLSFEFGLGFAKFGQLAGPVIGPMIGLEVLTSFFLEAGFLGIMLFGMGRVGEKLHFFATCMVTLGTFLSAAWILSANSWMQTPAGVAWDGGRLVVTDWLKVIVNPSWPYRLPHMLAAAYLTGSFVVSGIAAWYLLKGRHTAFAKRTLSMGLGFATILITTQVFLGDLLYGVMLKNQPAKMQAAEGFWEAQSEPTAPYKWIIVPDQANQRNTFEIATPYLGSIWLTHSLHGRVEGLSNTPVEKQPNMGFVFHGFRAMYATAILMFAVCAVSLWLRLRGRLYETRWFLKTLVWMTPAGLVATIGGWYTAEIGRQPYVIYGILKTVDAVSPVPAEVLLTTLVSFICIYTIFFTGFLVLTLKIIGRGPIETDHSKEATSHVSGSIKRSLMRAPHVAPARPAVVEE
jgi:cytochrome d ubiquinol oxidase subunit I